MSKRHDGVAWWDSQWSKRNSVRMGPKKDLFTPMMVAAKQRDFKVVMYFCYEEWATGMLGEDGKPCCRLWNWGAYNGTSPLTPENRRRVSGNIPVKNYYDQYMTPLVKEMIDRFDPDGLWQDGEWATPAETLRSRELAAYFYNKAGGAREFTVNDRYAQGTRDHHGDVFRQRVQLDPIVHSSWKNPRASPVVRLQLRGQRGVARPASRLIHRFIIS